jgi:drug/metabolite transporter (DMT)-like permease
VDEQEQEDVVVREAESGEGRSRWSGRQRKWSDLSPVGRVGTVVGGAVQLGLLLAALRDLRHRPAYELNGPRWAWVLASFVNFVGPIAYFAMGRRRSGGEPGS